MSQLGKEAIENLKLGIVALEQDYEKFEKGNKVAGTRARNTLQAMKVVCQGLRVEIQETKNNK
jgi:exonuclease VII small subunit